MAEGSETPDRNPDRAASSKLLDEESNASLDDSSARDAVTLSRDEDADELDPDAEILAHPEWGGVQMAAMAASFDGSVPAAMAAANSVLFWTMNVNGDIDNLTDGTNSLGEFFKTRFVEPPSEAATKKNDEDAWDDYIELARDRDEKRHEREQEECDRAFHRYGDVEMTGAEWGELGDELSKDSPLRRWLVDAYKTREHATDEQANAFADMVALHAKMMDTPQDQWTDQMRELDAKLKADPALDQKLQEYTSLAHANQDKTLSLGNTSGRDTNVLANADTHMSVTNRADAMYEDARAAPLGDGPKPSAIGVASNDLKADADFPTAPDLTEHHRAAAAATKPLDAKALQVAAASPMPAASAGLDI